MWLFSAKARPQTLHLNGFSPVWDRMCRTTLELFANIFPHTLHEWPEINHNHLKPSFHFVNMEIKKVKVYSW